MRHAKAVLKMQINKSKQVLALFVEPISPPNLVEHLRGKGIGISLNPMGFLTIPTS
jgi:hypothetical protein